MPVLERIAGGPDPQEVMRKTWGHLNATPDVDHPGVIVFAHGLYDGHVVLDVAFTNDAAGYGPWFYQHVHEWLADQDTKPGHCYRFSGTYRHDGDGHHEFRGDIVPVPLTTPATAPATQA